MITFLGVSILLLSIWGGVFYWRRKKSAASKYYYYLLFVMGASGILLPLDQYLLQVTKQFHINNILLFAVLMLLALIPWSFVDRWLYQSKHWTLEINDRYINSIKIVLLFIILSSLIAYVYCMPYAYMAYQMGGYEVRDMIRENSLMPVNLLSTFCYAVGYLAPIQVLCFYICMIDRRLSKYRVWVFLSSLSYLVTSAPVQARDGFVFIPLTYLFLFPIFRHSMNLKVKDRFKKASVILGVVALFFMGIITTSRFSQDTSFSSSLHSYIYGTYGYFYQQPFVFDNIVEYVPAEQGLSHRFMLICKVLNLSIKDYTPSYASLEQSFSTMYGSFYLATGFSSLFFASLFFVFSWTIVFSILINRNNISSLIICYSVFIYHVVSGLFYFRFSQESPMSLYILIIVLSFFLPNFMHMKLTNKIYANDRTYKYNFKYWFNRTYS